MRFLIISLLVLSFCGIYSVSKCVEQKPDSNSIWSVSGNKETINVKNDDVIRTTFYYPVIPKYLDSKLRFKIIGNDVIDILGQLEYNTNKLNKRDGRTGITVYFRARGEGKAKVEIRFLDSENKEVKEYFKSFYVEVK